MFLNAEMYPLKNGAFVSQDEEDKPRFGTTKDLLDSIQKR